ncbi:MAG: DUF4373 domain-containing protein [Lachnospiraceae bacterium]|nr:DUF4373 domain-containing protein [Lachnospiraceae bacterium]
MAKNKVGLDYFDLDCHMDEKIELIEAEFGLKGFAIIVKLYQSIYSGFGYYCEWTPDISVLWAYRLGCSHGVGLKGNVGSVCDECALPGFPNNLINEVVAASIRRNLFSGELFNKYSILTSSGIQKRYLTATSKRERIELKKEYLLISVGKNRENVVIIEDSDGRIEDSDGRIAQSRVEESRDKNIIVTPDGAADEHKGTDESYIPTAFELKCTDFLIQSILNDFPNQRVPKTDNEIKKWALHIRRIQKLNGMDEEKIWNTLVWTVNDSFWRTNVRSTSKFREKFQTLYLQSNGRKKTVKNSFNDFKQNDYDFDALEKELIQN